MANEVGCTPASITNILKPDATRSKLVPKIHKAFGWVDTAQPVSAIAKTEALRKLQSNWGHLTEAQQEMIASLSEQLAAVKR